jgi:hypothetical protein
MGKTRSSWTGHPFVALALALPSGVVFAFYKAFPDRKIEPRPGVRAIERSRRERERQRRLVEEAHRRVERIRELLRRASRY